MLDSMRKLSKSIVSKLLMFLLVVSFGIWGIGDVLRTSGPSYAAKVGNESISIGEFQQQRSLVARQLEAMNVKNLPQGQLELSVIRQLIQQKLTLQSIRDMGLFVNDKLAGDIIAKLPEFKGKDGKFSAEAFKATLARQHLSEQAFVSQLKNDVAGRFLIDSLGMKDATAPASIVMLDGLSNGETRDAVLLTIPAHDALDEKNDTALKAFYDENKTVLYMRPETRTLEYVVLTEGEIDALVNKSITDTMVNDAVAANKSLSKEAAREQLKKDGRDSVMRDLSNTVEDELAGGKSIGEAFTKAGIAASPRLLENANADMAKTSSDDITKTVAEQGFGLSEGEISRLIRSKQGTLLMVSAKKINAAAPKPYDEVKADVKTRLGKQLALEAARAKAQTVKAALAKAPNWQAVADEQKLASRVVSRIKRPIEGKAVETAGVPVALQQAIFERNIGEAAGPLALPNGDQVVAFITASHLPQASELAASSKDDAQMAAKLSQDIENRAFQSFTAKHKVVVNPALMRQAASATEE